jgi:hypothetical protein
MPLTKVNWVPNVSRQWHEALHHDSRRSHYQRRAERLRAADDRAATCAGASAASTVIAGRLCRMRQCKTRRPSDNCTGVIPSGACNKSCSTAGVDDQCRLPAAQRGQLRGLLARKAKLNAPTEYHARDDAIAAADLRHTPGCSDSKTMASFSLSVKLRPFERSSRVGSASRAAVKSFSSEHFLAALLAPVLIRGRALG